MAFRRGLVVLASAVLLSGSLVGPASAGDGVDGAEAHCVQEAASVGDSVDHPAVCFDTYAGSVAFLTGGAVELPADTRAADVSTEQWEQIEAAAAARSTFLLSIEYMDTSYGGSSRSFFGATDCNAADYAVSSMPAGWNNVIGSSQAFSSCFTTHYDLTGATPSGGPGGANYICAGSCASLGALNDATSSMRWF
jgi:hypothetical protein